MLKPCLALITLVGVLVGCQPAPAPPPPPTQAIRLYASSSTELLDLAERRSVTLNAVNGQGTRVPVPAGTWSTSDPNVATVDSTGKITGHRVGSTRVTYQAGKVSTTVLVHVADVRSGIRTFGDSLLKSPVRPVNPAAPPLPGSRYTVVLGSSERPEVGSVILGTGETGFAGRVTKVTATNNGWQVEFERVTPSEVFERFDFSASGPLTVNEAALTPTERPLSAQQTSDDSVILKYQVESVKALADQTFKLGPFTCVATGDVVLAPTTLEVKLQAITDYDLVLRDDQDGNARVRAKVSGQLIGTLTGLVKLGGALVGKFDCRKPDFYRIPIPVTGPLAWFFSPVVDLGMAMTIGGTLAVSSADVGFQGTLKTNLDLGFEYNSPTGFTNLSTLGGTGSLVPRLAFTGSEEVTLKAEVSAGPIASIGLGNALGSLSLISSSVGPVVEGDFASASLQAADAAYSSSYNARLQGKVEPGDSIAEVIKKLVSKVGRVNETALSLTLELPLSASPNGDGTASKNTYKPGDTVAFNVTLDPANTDFLGVYNVQEVQIYQLRQSDVGSRQARLVASSPAKDSQEKFALTWTADSEGQVKDNFYVFVRTTLVPPVVLELGQVVPQSMEVTPEGKTVGTGDTVTFTAKVDGAESSEVTWSATGGTITPAGEWTAPDTSGEVRVRATHKTDTSKFAEVTVRVVKLAVTPASRKVRPGDQVTFAATLDGVPTADVTWAASGGTITSEGVFTADSVSGVFEVTATSKTFPDVSTGVPIEVDASDCSDQYCFTPIDFTGIVGRFPTDGLGPLLTENAWVLTPRGLWKDGKIVTPAPANAEMTAVNEHGDFTFVDTLTGRGYVRFAGGRTVEIGQPGWSNTHPLGINDRGEVVGHASVMVGPSRTGRAFIWDEKGGARVLGDDTNVFTDAMDINERGSIAGKVNGNPALLIGGSVFVLPMPGMVHAINNLDTGAGRVFKSGENFYRGGAVITKSGYTILPDVLQWGKHDALDINDSGDVVGYDEAFHATLWTNGTRLDLNDVKPDGYTAQLQVAGAINNRGDILVTGVLPDGTKVTYLLRPMK